MGYAYPYMDTEATLARLEQKIDAMYASVEKTRLYFKWTLIATVVAFVLPVIGALFVIPSFIAHYTSTLNTLIQ